MEKKLKLSEILNLNQILRLIIDDTDSKTDALFKFRLLGILKEIEPHVSNFDIIRNEKIMEYGEETEEGNYQISKENSDAVEKFNNDLIRVLNSDVTIHIERLTANDVFNKGVTAEYLVGLYPIIETE